MKKWKCYEWLVSNYYRGTLKNNWNVSYDEKIIGKSGLVRQVDIMLTEKCQSMKIMIDCKCYKSKVDVKKVEAVFGMVEDIRANKGVIATPKGFTKGAVKRANEYGRLELVHLTQEKILPFRFQDNDDFYLICSKCSGNKLPFSEGLSYQEVHMKEYDVVKVGDDNYIRIDYGYCDECMSHKFYCNSCKSMLSFDVDDIKKQKKKKCKCGISILMYKNHGEDDTDYFAYYNEDKELSFENNLLHKYGFN